MDVEFLSRLQFAFTIMFHYIFPPFSIGLGALLVIFEATYLITKKPVYEQITRFFIKIFAANFSIGVATGIVMEFEFGTNWATYSRFVGDIFGSPLAAEGIFAFFLESGFLAVLLFGWNRVSKGFHMFGTSMVFLGSLMSGFWIIAANSWMQTPVAFEVIGEGTEAVARITDFWGMVFNPSTMVRFLHAIVGAFVQGGWLVLSISAYYILRNRHVDFAKRTFAVALVFVALASITQPLIGHSHAQVVAEYQPAKLAAYEGLYKTTKGAPLYLFGYTDPETQTTTGVALPKFLSFLAFGSFDAEVKGLDQFPKDEWPPVAQVFQSYHLMVALGMLFIGLTLFALILLWRGKLFNQRWLLWIFTFGVTLPVLANQMGWYSAERGRQPWIVQDLLKTSDALSKAVVAEQVLFSLILFGVLYLMLFLVWIYVLDREIKHGPADHSGPENYNQQKEMLENTLKNI